MQIQSTTPFSSMDAPASTTSSSSTGSTASSSTNSTNSANSLDTPTESMFLQLLIAQMKNQDPTSPQDPTQFVGELAQFSELEQVLGIRQDTDTMVQDMSASATSASANNNSTQTQTTKESPAQTTAA